ERFLCLNSHDLPVAGHGVLPVAPLSQGSLISKMILHRRYLTKWSQVGHSQLLESRNPEIFYCFRYMSQGIYSNISELFSVRHSSDSQGIDYDGKYTFIFF